MTCHCLLVFVTRSATTVRTKIEYDFRSFSLWISSQLRATVWDPHSPGKLFISVRAWWKRCCPARWYSGRRVGREDIVATHMNKHRFFCFLTLLLQFDLLKPLLLATVWCWWKQLLQLIVSHRWLSQTNTFLFLALLAGWPYGWQCPLVGGITTDLLPVNKSLDFLLPITEATSQTTSHTSELAQHRNQQ